MASGGVLGAMMRNQSSCARAPGCSLAECSWRESRRPLPTCLPRAGKTGELNRCRQKGKEVGAWQGAAMHPPPEMRARTSKGSLSHSILRGPLRQSTKWWPCGPTCDGGGMRAQSDGRTLDVSRRCNCCEWRAYLDFEIALLAAHEKELDDLVLPQLICGPWRRRRCGRVVVQGRLDGQPE